MSTVNNKPSIVSKRRASTRTVLILAGIGLTLSLLAMFLQRYLEHREIAANFYTDASQVISASDRAITNLIDDLEYVSSIYAASQTVERREFRVFVRHLLDNSPGLMEVQWIPVVKNSQREAFESAARQKGLKDYRITEYDLKRGLVRAATHDRYYPVLYSESIERMKNEPGYDLASNPAFREALDRAARSGKIAATGGTLRSLQNGLPTDLTAFLPIYRKNAPVEPAARGHQDIMGFVAGRYRIENVLNIVLAQLGLSTFTLTILDLSQSQDTTPEDETLLTRQLTNELLSDEDKQLNDFAYLHQLKVGGRQWALICSAGEEYIAEGKTWKPWGIFGIGLLITLFVVNRKHTRQLLEIQRDHLQELVEEKTIGLRRYNKKLKERITRGQQTEEALRKSEERLNLALDAVNDGLWDFNPQTGDCYFSPRWFTMLGYGPGEISRFYKDWTYLVYPEDLPNAEAKIQTSLQTGEDLFTEFRMRAKDGRWVYIQSRGKVVAWDDNGQAIRMVGTHSDVTARKQAEEAFRKSETEKQVILDSLAEQVIYLDLKMNILWANRTACEFLGATRKDIIGRKCYKAWGNREKPCLDCPVILARQSGHQEFSDTHTPDGRFCHAQGYPVRDDNNRVIGMVKLNLDITERHRAEQELKTFMAKLERSNRELQDFASVASHDLQEPLRKVQTFGNRLASVLGDSLDEKPRDYLERMLNATRRMQNLVNDLLTFSRVTTRAKPYTPTDLNAVVQGVLSDLEVAIEQTRGRIDIGELPTIDADPTQMRQLLQNLISNALKFHHQDRRPVVEISADFIISPVDPTGCCGENCEYCRLTVRDNGIGFDEKYSDRIFAVFQRLHSRNQYDGTGVGLAVCRKIVERHGGTITVTSQPGCGTTFTVLLPVRQQEEGSAYEHSVQTDLNPVG